DRTRGIRRAPVCASGAHGEPQVRALLASPARYRRASGPPGDLRPLRRKHLRRRRAEALGVNYEAARAQADPNGALRWLWLSGLVIVLDQLSKLVITSYLELYDRIEVLPVFGITRLHNTGAAFSFLAGAGGWQRWFFITI